MKANKNYTDVKYFRSKSSFLGFYATPIYNYYLEGIAIDTNYPKFGSTLLANLRRLDPIHAIILTHSHIDHSGNAGLIMNAYGCPLYAHKLFERRVALLTKIHPVFRHYYGMPVRGDKRLLTHHREKYETRNYELHLIPFPGHTQCMVGFYEPNQKWLFSGDAVPLPEKKRDSSIEENMTLLLDSLKRIYKMNLEVIFTGHSGPINKVNEFIEPRLEWLESFSKSIKELRKEGMNPKKIRKTLVGREKLYTYFIHGEHSCLNSVLSFITNKPPKEISEQERREILN